MLAAGYSKSNVHVRTNFVSYVSVIRGGNNGTGAWDVVNQDYFEYLDLQTNTVARKYMTPMPGCSFYKVELWLDNQGCR